MFSTSLVRVLGGLLPDSPPSPSMLPTTTTHLSQLEPHKGMEREAKKSPPFPLTRPLALRILHGHPSKFLPPWQG